MSSASSDRKESEASTSSSSSVEWSEPCRHFEFSEIQLATENFHESLVIGSGGFGKVYKGNLINGSNLVTAAIKRLDSMSKQGADEFWAEVKLLSKLRHTNLVSLIGYCNYEAEMILVYEYMPNGTLEDHLHKLRTPLSWIQRINICIDAGRGLHYLHTGTGLGSGVVHRDVKTSNILLHESWAGKVSDFGLSRIGRMNQPSTYINTRVKGTFGYLDPDYFYSGRLTRKSDVYAFGVVLFEVLCRKRAVDSSLDEEQWNLARWAQESIKDGNLKHIIDSDTRGEISPKCLKKFVHIAERCLQLNRNQRPTMADVVTSLESVLTLQEKMNNSLQSSSGSILGKMLDMLSFSSNGENSGRRYSKLLSNSKGNNRNSLKRAPIEIIISPQPNLRVFSFAELRAATRNFQPDSVLGEGGFGKVYKGWLKDKFISETNVIAVKKLNSESLQGWEEWQAEVNFLGRLSHPNLVKLFGYCYEDKELLLVYEFMEKGSLENHLFGRGSTVQPLPWDIRLKIIIEAARGLASLHTSEKQVIYRDFKPSNILLDGAYNAKLSDFGLAKMGPSAAQSHVTTRIMGTHGYAAPEYVSTGHLYVKSDVYGFGMVLVEILTGKRAIDINRPAGQQYLVDWVIPFLSHRSKLKNIMDTRFEGKYPSKSAFRIAHLAVRCLNPEPRTRPSMEEVAEKLEQLDAIN